jgi:hypothetical protein
MSLNRKIQPEHERSATRGLRPDDWRVRWRARLLSSAIRSSMVRFRATPTTRQAATDASAFTKIDPVVERKGCSRRLSSGQFPEDARPRPARIESAPLPNVLGAAGEGTKMADHLSPIFRPAFPSSAIISERSSPSRVRCAAPNNGAPLTAPGRSGQLF